MFPSAHFQDTAVLCYADASVDKCYIQIMSRSDRGYQAREG